MPQELKDAGVVRSISREERDQILRHLKLKWASVNTAYQKMTFTLDTPAKQVSVGRMARGEPRKGG